MAFLKECRLLRNIYLQGAWYRTRVTGAGRKEKVEQVVIWGQIQGPEYIVIGANTHSLTSNLFHFLKSSLIPLVPDL